MIEVDVEEAQANLKEYIDKAILGERVVLRSGPFHKFELTPVLNRVQAPPEGRKIGVAIGKVTIHPEFYEPLPDDILAYFEGRGEGQEEELK